MQLSFEIIVTIPGHSGLFKMVRPTHHGVLVETIDQHKVRSVKNMQSHKISTLKDIGIYTTDEEDTLSLATVLPKLHDIHKAIIPADQYDSSEKLQSLLHHVVPNYDRDRVYASNIKKIIHWYNVLAQHLPEIFEQENLDPKETTATTEAESSDKQPLEEKQQREPAQK